MYGWMLYPNGYILREQSITQTYVVTKITILGKGETVYR